MLKSLRLEKGVAGRAIIWGEKKNDLSSGCQQRKRLCLGQRERAWLEPVQAPLRLDAGAGGGGREKVWALAVATLWRPGAGLSPCATEQESTS